MTLGDYGSRALESLRILDLATQNQTPLEAGDEGPTVFLLANELPLPTSASLLGHPVGPNRWTEVAAKQQLLKDLATEILDTATVIAPPRDISPESQEVLERIKTGRTPSSAALTSLGAELLARRPVLPVEKLELLSPSNEFHTLWKNFRKYVASVLPSVGVIGNAYLVDGRAVHAPQGTAWMVAPELVATNLHVATSLMKHGWIPGVGGSSEPGPGAVVEFAVQRESKGPTARCVDLVASDAEADVALISVSRKQVRLPRPVKISARSKDLGFEPQQLVDRKVAIIGYPLPDERRNPLLGDIVLQLSGGYEAAALGAITRTEGITFRHDCSTTGGNSGSPVLDMSTGAILGIHRGGNYVLGSNIASHVDTLHVLLANNT